MKKGLLTFVVFVAIAAGAGAQGLFAPGGFFCETPLFKVLDYSPAATGTPGRGWRISSMVLEQANGYVLIAFEEFDTTTGIATGRVSMQRRTDTTLANCKDAETGIPIPCTSGAVIQ